MTILDSSHCEISDWLLDLNQQPCYMASPAVYLLDHIDKFSHNFVDSKVT